MNAFSDAVDAAFRIMQIPLVIGDYTFTFWQMFIFFSVAGAVVNLIYKIFD